jgi:hypothetical protein
MTFSETVEGSWPWLVGLSVLLIAVTLILLVRGDPVPLAAWLIYMYAP